MYCYDSSISKALAVTRPFLTLVCALGWVLRVHNRYAFLVYQMSMHRLFGETFTIEAKRRYREHNDRIRALVPKEKLLELRLGQHGWEPLCQFLNVDIPKADYPRTNATSDMNKKMELVTWYTCRLVFARLGAYFLAVAATLYAVRYGRATWARIGSVPLEWFRLP